MKYGYAGISSEDLIKDYYIEHDKIIINFLDGSYYEVAFTDDNEQSILNLMLEQAQKRHDSSALRDAVFRSKAKLAPTVSTGILSLCCIANGVINSRERESLLLGLLSLTAFMGFGSLTKCSIDEINELRKYGIYLSIRERLDQITDHNLFNEINNGQTVLNINTLDNYSLKEIKQIRKNLARCEEYAETFRRVDSEPMLVKKISK